MLITLGFFLYTVKRLVFLFKLTKPFKIGEYSKRIALTLNVAMGQTKIFRMPVVGLMHALVFWGFCLIVIGSVEIVLEGIFGLDKPFANFGVFYNFLSGSGDVFAFLIFVLIAAFMVRRLFMNINRLHGSELSHRNHNDAFIALSFILVLMVSLIGMNIFYVACHPNGDYHGSYPFSAIFASFFTGLNHDNAVLLYEIYWWTHIVLVFVFANMLPYSKHFHVFLSVPNVFLSRLEPLGKLPNMDNITREVKLMMNPETAFAASSSDVPPERFGVKDAEDVTWKNYLDSLTCTQCGRCSSVCPANTTGKKLSPRKIMMDLRARMNEKGKGILKAGKDFNDGKSLLRDYVSQEEIWACTTCNACAMECPVNINHPTLIVDLRRYSVLEESSAPAGLNSIFNNITNNGAPWQFSPQDRMNWANDIVVCTDATKK